MRAYPVAWPVTDGLDDTLPTVYLHLLDSAWPPADDEMGTPAGWAQVIGWSIDGELDAPLLPGQINTSPAFNHADADCSVAQSDGTLLAPWRGSAERTPTSGRAELVASFNGPEGSTAFVLGQFILDPLKGKLSDSSLTIKLIKDTVKLRRPHSLPRRWGTTFSPTRLLERGAVNAGYVLDSTADFDAVLTSLYFPRKTDQLAAMQSIVAANLGAMFLSMDGTTLHVLDPDYLLGDGAVIETLEVDDDLDDLVWSQDPSAAVDRIEITFLPPNYDDTPMGPLPYDAAAVWFAPKGAALAPGETITYDFDPGTDIAVNGLSAIGRGTLVQIYGNTAKDGTGGSVDLDGWVSSRSSGSYSVEITNTTGVTRYLVAPYIPPSAGFGITDYTKGTRSFITGTINGARESESTSTLVWGAAAEDATNALTVDLGRNIQREVDAQMILDRIITRVSNPTYTIEDVRVPVDFRRELG